MPGENSKPGDKPNKKGSGKLDTKPSTVTERSGGGTQPDGPPTKK